MFTRIKIAGNLQNDVQSIRRALGCHAGLKSVHSSSVGSEPVAAAAQTSEATSPGVEPLQSVRNSPATGSGRNLLEIEDGRVLYSGLKTKELASALFNLQLVSWEPMVDLSLRVLMSPLMRFPLTSVPIMGLVKRTAYSHFCAGKDPAEAGVTLSRLWELGIKGVLDYSLEDAEDNETCDKNYAGFLKTIHATASIPAGAVSFVCVKISAIYPISLLERVSDHLRWQHKNPDYKFSWKADDVRVLSPESPTYHTQQTPAPMTEEEQRDLVRAEERWSHLCKACAEYDLPILIDAEYSSIQPAIDYLTCTAAFEYNRSGRPVVYGTVQTYFKDAPSRLSLAMKEASRRNVFLAVKLVRGAYITRELSLAAGLGVPSPIHSSIGDTHNCYNMCASTMLDRVSSGNSAVMLATHNLDSGRLAAQRADELGLDRADPRVHFAQLKGMSDRLSLALAQSGFHVSKYIPFGAVERVIPYLVRRAEENRGLLGNTLADRQSLSKELRRRLGSAVGLQQARYQ